MTELGPAQPQLVFSLFSSILLGSTNLFDFFSTHVCNKREEQISEGLEIIFGIEIKTETSWG